MKRITVTLSLLILSTSLFAGYCGNLGITIINVSSHDCVLRNTQVDSGLFQDQAPITIPSNSTSPTFYMAQDNNGVRVLLDYRCDNKAALFYSEQDYCGFRAGNVIGYPLYATDMGLDYQVSMGSYWSAIPGQITWRIYP